MAFPLRYVGCVRTCPVHLAGRASRRVVSDRVVSRRAVSQSHSQYLVNLVRRYDYESYLCLLLLPKHWRYPCFVFHAYNVELSLVLESAKEPRAASGRFAFWNDTIDGIFQGKQPSKNPVVSELHRAINNTSMPSASSRKWLTQMLAAREQLCRVTHVPSTSFLEDFSEKTRSSLLYLCLAATGCSDVNTDHAASHLGRCLGLVTALRSTPYLASRSQLLLPQDLLSKHKTSQQDVLRGRETLKEPVFDLASTAHEHLAVAIKLLKDVSKEARAVLLPIIICEHRLELLRKCDFNVFDKTFQAKSHFLAWQLWRGKRKLMKS